jgi:hypothetical protein
MADLRAKGWVRDPAVGGLVIVRETGSCELWGSRYEFTALQEPQGASWTAFKDSELIGSGLATDLEAARNAAERCAAPTSTRLAELRRALGRAAP